MKPNILMTPQFKQAFKLLKKKHQNNILRDIIKIIEQLVNFEITTQKSNHPLSDGINDLHIRGDVILLYRYQGVGLIIDLNLLNITDHKELQKNLKLAMRDNANIPFDLEKEKKNLKEQKFETSSYGQILQRGDLNKYKISDEELEKVRRREMINENTITGTLPPSIDKFLMDMSQMYIDDLNYTDISKFGDRATEEDIKQLRKYKMELSQGFEEDDPEIQEIFKNIKNIVKGNLKEDTNISIDNMEVNIDKVKNKSVRVDEDQENKLEEIPPHDRDQLLIELKDVTDNFTIPNDTIVVGYESEKDYVIDILSENGYECENSMKGEWFEISFRKKEISEESLTEDMKEEKYNIGSNKLNITEEEKQRLEDLASRLMANSPNDYKYQVKETYEDYSSGMKWFNIICYNRSGDSWQVLNTKEWLDLMNTGDIDSVYQSVVNDKYFQDKQKELHEMNLGEIFNYLKD